MQARNKKRKTDVQLDEKNLRRAAAKQRVQEKKLAWLYETSSFVTVIKGTPTVVDATRPLQPGEESETITYSNLNSRLSRLKQKDRFRMFSPEKIRNQESMEVPLTPVSESCASMIYHLKH
jgi:hypothetical protein